MNHAWWCPFDNFVGVPFLSNFAEGYSTLKFPQICVLLIFVIDFYLSEYDIPCAFGRVLILINGSIGILFYAS
jgi:hypothetical protein